MPRQDQKLVNGISWDGRGRVDVGECYRNRHDLKELVDYFRDHSLSYGSTYWVEANFDWIFIAPEDLNKLTEALRNAHRSLYENSQSSNQLVLAKDNAENSLTRYQSENYNLQTEKSNLQRLIEAGKGQLAVKDNQIATLNVQLANSQNQFNQSQNQLMVRNNAFDALTQQLNALQIESNNKNNEINTLREELDGSRNIDLRYRERKLDELVRNSGLNRERVDNLRDAYERLKRARDGENYNQEEVIAAQNEIDAIKREFLQTNVSVEDLHKIYKVCEKVAELRVKSEQNRQQQFEAQTQQAQPPRNY